jgi:CheY-like chemotaxis protein
MLQKTPGVDGVLMDIMKPGMEASKRCVRSGQIGKFKSVPIIAVTAKAMKGDRQKCIEGRCVGLHHKAVETEQLMSLLRIWLDN